MWKRLRTNLGYRILSLLLALGLWMFVLEERNPTMENIFTVPVEVVNLPSDLVIADKPANVRIRVEGREAIIKDLAPRDFKAYLDLSGTQRGTVQENVIIRLPEGVNLLSVSPGQISITVDRVAERQMPVTVTYRGRQVSGFRPLEPVLKPSQVLVSGPQGLLDQLTLVWVEVNLDGLRGNYLEHLPVRVAADAEGAVQREWIKVTPQMVEVFIPVVRDLPEKILPVRVNLAGEPAEGYRVQRVIFDPEEMRVFGPADELDNITELQTASVDISGATADVSRQVDVLVPPKITIGHPRPIRVLVQIAKGPEGQTGQ